MRTLNRSLKKNHPDDLAAMTLFLEARDQPPAGKLAIGRVIRNRMAKRNQSDGTVIGTVLKDWQFSAWNPGTLPNKKHSKAIEDNFKEAFKVDLDSKEFQWYKDIWRASEKIDQSRFPATMYHATSMGFPKTWNRKAIKQEIGEIGTHTFYED